nr:MAG TPA: 4Fe-4S single cluster domain protein [Caudoviricetes sp.]
MKALLLRQFYTLTFFLSSCFISIYKCNFLCSKCQENFSLIFVIYILTFSNFSDNI